MSMHRSLAAALWLLAALGAYAIIVAWADEARDGKIPPWTLVAMFWAVALVSVTIHHVSQYLGDHLAGLPEALRRYAGAWQRQGAALALRLTQPIVQRLPARPSVARIAAPVAAAPAMATSARTPYPWTLVAAVRGAAAGQAAMHRLAEMPDALRRWWMQATVAASLLATHSLAVAEEALKWCWLQVNPIGHTASTLRAAGGYSVTLATRLGSLIGVR